MKKDSSLLMAAALGVMASNRKPKNLYANGTPERTVDRGQIVKTPYFNEEQSIWNAKVAQTKQNKEIRKLISG